MKKILTILFPVGNLAQHRSHRPWQRVPSSLASLGHSPFELAARDFGPATKFPSIQSLLRLHCFSRCLLDRILELL